MSVFSIEGKVAVITGANRGLGRQMAEGFAEAGAQVAVLDLKIDPETLQSLSVFGQTARGYELDLSCIEEYDELVKRVCADFGTVDILVNNAGVQKRHPSIQFPKEDWDFVMGVNCDAVFFLCQKFGQVMLEKQQGKIINIASLLSFQGGYTVPAYAASKSAVMGFTKSLSNEWASKGVQVNCIAPGYMDTEMNVAIRQDAVRDRQILDRIPAGRWGTPKDLVGPALFLASSASDYISGYTLAVDGGWLGR